MSDHSLRWGCCATVRTGAGSGAPGTMNLWPERGRQPWQGPTCPHVPAVPTMSHSLGAEELTFIFVSEQQLRRGLLCVTGLIMQIPNT